MDTKSPICVWDITFSKEKVNTSEIKDFCKKYCKKWTFQEELGTSKERAGYYHYQGRISLKLKARKSRVVNLLKTVIDFEKFHPDAVSETSCENFQNDFYCLKEHSKVIGGWEWTDKTPDEEYIPIQYRNIELKKWQQDILNGLGNNNRSVNILWDDKGNIGKSTLSSIGELKYNCVAVPPVNDMKDLLQSVCNILMSENNRSPNCIFMDLPRAMEKKRLIGIYSAIEEIKKGKVFDTRNRYKKWWFDSPNVWIFTNVLPSLKYLSSDRWNIWRLENNELVKQSLDFDVVDESDSETETSF